MKYEFSEASKYLSDIARVVFARSNPDSLQRIGSPEFSVLCKDLIESLHDLQKSSLDFGMNLTHETLQGMHDSNPDTERMTQDYFVAVGVVAASIELSEQPKALSYASRFIGEKSSYFAIDCMRFGYRAKLAASGYKSYQVVPREVHREFSPAVEGFVVLSEGEYFRNADLHVLMHEISKVGNFLEKLEKTRGFSPDWKINAEIAKSRYEGLADVIGRKNDDLKKIFLLVNDGSPSVSISDCVRATHIIAESLLNPTMARQFNFSAEIDVLDEHPDFWKVAFQEELRNKLSGYPLLGELRHWGIEDRMIFKKNLSELNKRMQDKVVDPDVMLSSILMGQSITSSLVERDRAQGDPRWLERSILEQHSELWRLREPESSLSIVMDALLERTGEEAIKEFWHSCEEMRGFPVRERWRLKEVSDDQGPSL